MKPRSTAISVLALLGLAMGAGAALARPGLSTGTAHGLPPVSARPPGAPSEPAWLPGEVLTLLPPGARAPGAVAVLEVDGEPGASSHALVERVPVPGRAPGAGDWVELEYTIDPHLDAQVRAVLEQGRVPLGHVIVMDPADGAVLSYVSTDPLTFPATRTYPTASLMKVVTAAAVLRRAPEAAKRSCRYAGSPYEVRKRHLTPPRSGGRVDSFWRALAISNNQCFARLAVRDLGAEAVLDEMKALGLLEAPAPGHAAGVVEPIESTLDLGHLGSGLAGSFISPLAAVRLAGVLARGQSVRPRWIARARDPLGRDLLLPLREAPVQVWPPELSAELRELMVGVTARGTAKSAFRNGRGAPLLGPVRVSGKTGRLSGKNPEGRYEWFIGVAPAEQPSVAIAAVVVNGPLWWSNASQIAARVLHGIFCDGGPCRPEAARRLRPDTVAREPEPRASEGSDG
ncbi:MAG: penicillin-binding transpeptidase domain-containing protein [Myxococcota bacterium]|nr:penicillin-binding transpeptidase domain-containing protein [Myxococcota bacterium]